MSETVDKIEISRAPASQELRRMIGQLSLGRPVTKNQIEKLAQISNQVENLEHDNVRDELTGVYNLKALYPGIVKSARRLRRNTPESSFALAVLDLDRFKAINDTFGHAAGDQALVHAASGLMVGIRADDAIYRVGGDEFVLYLNDIPFGQNHALERALGRVSATLNLPFVFENHQMQIEYSIGYQVATPAEVEIVTSSNDEILAHVTIDKLRATADENMYTHKSGVIE